MNDSPYAMSETMNERRERNLRLREVEANEAATHAALRQAAASEKALLLSRYALWVSLGSLAVAGLAVVFAV